MLERHSLLSATMLAAMLAVAVSAGAYPDFQAWSQKNSGRGVNCGMCHVHPDGPEGVKAGQIGALRAAQLQALTDARLAFKPGATVDSPILNEFGDSILRQLGRTEIISLRLNPGEIAARLDPKSDLDADGIPDAKEFVDGTDPLDAQSGSPWLLFKNGLVREKFHIVMIVLATVFGLYGLHHLLHGLHQVARRASPKDAKRAAAADRHGAAH